MTSPLRQYAEQTRIEDIADGVLNMKLDLEELRATALTHRARNLEWVGEVADQFAMLLMTAAPLSASFGYQPQHSSSQRAISSRLSSDAPPSPVARAAARRAEVAQLIPVTTPTGTRRADGSPSDPGPLALRGPPRDDHSGGAPAMPMLLLPAHAAAPVQMPALTARRLLVPRLSSHTTMETPTVLDQHPLRTSLPTTAAAVEPAPRAVVGVSPDPPSPLAGMDSIRGVHLACTTFGSSAIGAAADDALHTMLTADGRGGGPPSRKGKRSKGGRLVHPLDPALTMAGQEDQRLVAELEGYRRTAPRPNPAPLTASLPRVHESFNTTQPRQTTPRIAEAWTTPRGMNYREPFLPDSTLEVGTTNFHSTLMSTGGGASYEGSDVVIAMPGAGSTDKSHQADRAFHTNYGRRIRAVAVPDAAVAFSSRAPRGTESMKRAGDTARRPEPPKLHVVMTRIG
jgi:hypothetical protein